MSEISGRYAQLSAAFADAVAKVPGDRWENQSPCEEWTARDVVRHVVDTQGYFLGLVGRGLGEIPSVDDDPAVAWDAARAVVQADLDDPERAGAEFDGFFGRTRFDAGVDMFLTFDLVVHRWDLARATGGDDLIAPSGREIVWERVAKFGDNIRREDVCGEEVTPPEGADEQTRLLAKLGRQA